MVKMALCHIGLYKTGTTFLQQHVFSQDSNYFYYEKNHALRDLIWGLNNISPFEIDEIAREFDRLNTYDRLFISREDLSGNPLTNYQDFDINMNFLKRASCKPGFIVTIRRQDNLLESTYKHYIQSGGTKKVRAFLSLRRGYIRKQGRSVDWHLDFNKVVERLQSEFPEATILVLPYELMRADLGAFCTIINDVFNVGLSTVSIPSERSNQSITSELIPFMRVLNQVVKYRHHDAGLINENPMKATLSILPNSKLKRYLIHHSGRFHIRRIFQRSLSPLFPSNRRTIPTDIKQQIWDYHAPLNKEFDKKYSSVSLADFGYY